MPFHLARSLSTQYLQYPCQAVSGFLLTSNIQEKSLYMLEQTSLAFKQNIKANKHTEKTPLIYICTFSQSNYGIMIFPRLKSTYTSSFLTKILHVHQETRKLNYLYKIFICIVLLHRGKKKKKGVNEIYESQLKFIISMF